MFKYAVFDIKVKLDELLLMPILLNGLEVLNLNKSQLNSVDFVANRF